MKLNVFERLSLLSVLPEEGNFITLKIVRDIQSKLSFSEDDIKDMDIQETAGSVKWNSKGNDRAEIEVGEKATDVIINAFKALDAKNKLSLKILPLYERIVIGEEETDGDTA